MTTLQPRFGLQVEYNERTATSLKPFPFNKQVTEQILQAAVKPYEQATRSEVTIAITNVDNHLKFELSESTSGYGIRFYTIPSNQGFQATLQALLQKIQDALTAIVGIRTVFEDSPKRASLNTTVQTGQEAAVHLLDQLV